MTRVVDPNTGNTIIPGSHSSAMDQYTASVQAGEGNESSYFESFVRIRHQLIPTVLGTSTVAQNIGASGTTPIILGGVYLTNALTGTLTLSGFTDPTGAAVNLVLPASTPAGAALVPSVDLQMDTGCTATISAGTDGPHILVAWRNQ